MYFLCTLSLLKTSPSIPLPTLALATPSFALPSGWVLMLPWRLLVPSSLGMEPVPRYFNCASVPVRLRMCNESGSTPCSPMTEVRIDPEPRFDVLLSSSIESFLICGFFSGLGEPRGLWTKILIGISSKYGKRTSEEFLREILRVKDRSTFTRTITSCWTLGCAGRPLVGGRGHLRSLPQTGIMLVQSGMTWRLCVPQKRNWNDSVRASICNWPPSLTNDMKYWWINRSVLTRWGWGVTGMV